MPNRDWTALFSSATDNWPTPQWLFDALNSEFAFTLDPCSSKENAKCACHFTVAEDDLAQDWGSHSVFMNPLYGRTIGRWIHKAYESSRRGALVVCLLPARTDTRWWHDYVMRGEVRPIRGRLHFGNSVNSAPFLSAGVVFWPPEFRSESFRVR